MQTQLCYTNNKKLESIIKEKKIIPHRILPGEKLIVGEKYYDGYHDKIFKVISVEYNEDGSLDGAYIKMDDGNYAWISSDLDIANDYYITNDNYSIHSINIINNKHIYSGAEIRYWFFINDITVMNRKYSCFWPYIDPTNPGSIDDSYTYIISADVDENGNYIKPRIVHIMGNYDRLNVKAKEYWEKLVERDKERMNNKRKRRKY